MVSVDACPRSTKPACCFRLARGTNGEGRLGFVRERSDGSPGAGQPRAGEGTCALLAQIPICSSQLPNSSGSRLKDHRPEADPDPWRKSPWNADVWGRRDFDGWDSAGVRVICRLVRGVMLRLAAGRQVPGPPNLELRCYVSALWLRLRSVVLQFSLGGA